MKGNISIQLKAAILLIVFSMNTVIGFVCAIGVDMGFNNKHHHDDGNATEAADYVHADGKKHQHHDEATKHHHDSKEGSEKGGCCNDAVIKFQNLDKNLNPNNNSAISIPVFAAILTSFFGLAIFTKEQVPNQKHIAQLFHPPPPGIRVLIQSFQI